LGKDSIFVFSFFRPIFGFCCLDRKIPGHGKCLYVV
jgi:hypothetical protein